MKKCWECKKEFEDIFIREDGLCSSCYLEKSLNKTVKRAKREQAEEPNNLKYKKKKVPSDYTESVANTSSHKTEIKKESEVPTETNFHTKEFKITETNHRTIENSSNSHLNSTMMMVIAILLAVIVVLLLVLINKTPSGPDCYSTSDGRGTICDYPDGSRRIFYK